MTSPGSQQDWQQRDLVPRPDPTLLTNAAIEQVTVQYRRELAQLQVLLSQRMDAMDLARQTYLEVLSARELTFEAKLGALDRRLDERYATQTKAIDAAFTAAETAVARALDSAEKAVTKAELATEVRFQGVNEFRQALTDQAGTFLPRAQYDAAHTALVEVTSELRSRLDGMSGAIVSREESEAWRNALLDKISTVTDRIGTLELRLTSRLDLSAGADTGAAAQASEHRAAATGINQVMVVTIMVVSVLVAIGSIIALIVKK